MDVDGTHDSWPDGTHDSCQDACKIVNALSLGDSLFKRLFKGTFVNEGFKNTRVGNPGMPAFIIGSTDASTPERQEGLQALGQ